MPSQRSHIGMNYSLNYSLNRSINGNNNTNKNNRETQSMIIGLSYSNLNNSKKHHGIKHRKLPNYTLTNFTLPAHLQIIIPNFYNHTANNNINNINNNGNNIIMGNHNETVSALGVNPRHFGHKQHKQSASGGSIEEQENNSFSHKSQHLLLSGNINSGNINQINRNRTNSNSHSHSHSRSHSH